MTALTIFKVDFTPSTDLPDGFDEVVEPDLLSQVRIHDYVSDDLVARLYVPRIEPGVPRWTPFVREGFPDVQIGRTQSRKALLLASVSDSALIFGLAFGHARYDLRDDVVDPTFGRRAAVNLIYESDPEADAQSADRVRQVDARTMEDNVRRARIQRSRDATFETFGIDPERDLLDRIVGVPHDTDRYGRRITGGRSLRLDTDLSFDDLPGLLSDVATAHSRTTYRRNFSWVDQVTAVKDEALLDHLRMAVLELIKGGSADVDLAPPEIVDWDNISTFTYEFGERTPRMDLKLNDYLEAIESSRVRDLTPDKLAAHRVAARDGDGKVIHRWPVFRCVTAEFELDGVHYVLDAGHFYVVAADYLSGLKEFIATLPGPKVSLPATRATTLEAKYNEKVVSRHPDRLLLDRKLIQPDQRTSSIEICDVLTADGELVHVKRKLGSSGLSHLFAQGYVSAETIHAGPDLRTLVRARIEEQAKRRRRDAKAFLRPFNDPFEAKNATVVYAIIADWGGKPPSERLPFFSMVNLRHYTKRLRSMGFDVALAAVNAPSSR